MNHWVDYFSIWLSLISLNCEPFQFDCHKIPWPFDCFLWPLHYYPTIDSFSPSTIYVPTSLLTLYTTNTLSSLISLGSSFSVYFTKLRFLLVFQANKYLQSVGIPVGSNAVHTNNLEVVFITGRWGTWYLFVHSTIVAKRLKESESEICDSTSLLITCFAGFITTTISSIEV